MWVVENEEVFPSDVDGTLVVWDETYDCPKHEMVPCIDPYDGSTVWLKPHKPHIRLLKEKKARGAFIIVWSKGGGRWAKVVIKALGLEHYVDLCCAKNSSYLDDVPVEEWMKERIYLPPTSQWKAVL